METQKTPSNQPQVSDERTVVGRQAPRTTVPAGVIESPIVVANQPAKTSQVVRSSAGRLTLLHPTRAYAVSHNPFSIAAILPLLVLSFIGLEIAVLANVDAIVATGGFLVVSLGLLLVSAVNLRGSLTLTHDGVSFENGKHQITADWEHVAGIVMKSDSGLCLEIVDPQMTETKMRLPGGLSASEHHALIPLRLFGDRQYSILYDLRERLPEERWMNALKEAGQRSSTRILVVYGMTTLICIGAILATFFAVNS